VDEHGNLLLHRVGLEKELALVLEILLDVLVAQTLEAQGKPRSQNERAPPKAQQLQLISSSHLLIPQASRLRLIVACVFVYAEIMEVVPNDYKFIATSAETTTPLFA